MFSSGQVEFSYIGACFSIEGVDKLITTPNYGQTMFADDVRMCTNMHFLEYAISACTYVNKNHKI